MEESPIAIGRPFLELFASADALESRELLLRWVEFTEHAKTDHVEGDVEGGLDPLPQNMVITRDGRLALPDTEFRSTEESRLGRDRLVERGVLWLGLSLSRDAARRITPDARNVRQVVAALGQWAGLPANGQWIPEAVRRETVIQGPKPPKAATRRQQGVRRRSEDRPVEAEQRVWTVDEWHSEFDRLLDTEVGSLGEGTTIVSSPASDQGDAPAGVSDRVRWLSDRLAQNAAELGTVREVSRREIAVANAQAAVLRAELARINSSKGYRLIRAGVRSIDRVAPWGTHRRGLVERSLKVANAMARGTRGLRTSRPAVVGATRVPPLRLSATPLVSIVIPVYGKWSYTSRCLASIARWDEGHTVEVIVVDDASPDDSLTHLRKVKGIRLLALAENHGFTRASNAGIAAAKGDFVVMLNNDAEVTAGWLSALLAAAEDSSVGFVGAKLVYPDGRLQEAGGIIFDDANGWNYGKFQDPNAPEYNFRKSVDFSSGAAILLTRELISLTGGFDERYAPAYYEDVDIAFEARKHGLKVLYEPKSVVIHHEGISHGSDEMVGIKRYQPINRLKFMEKWGAELTAQRANDHANVALASVRRAPGGTIVVVDHMVPRWRDDAGSLRMMRMLVSLVDLGYDVVFVPDNKDPFEPYTSELTELGVLVWYGFSDLWGYLRSIESEVRAVFLSRASVASVYLRQFREVLPETPVIFDTVDLHFLREERRVATPEAGGKVKSAQATKELELALIRSADATVVVSDFEVEVIGELLPQAPVFVLPTTHDSVSAGSLVGRTEITFVGSFQHDPNVDAVRWLVTEIYPRVRRLLPEITLTVVGRNPPVDIVDAAPDGVDFLGWVEDLGPIHERSLVSVAPIRYGAGVKGKVGEAWAHGVPVVMTSLASEGMHVVPGETALVEDDASKFAEAVVRVALDPDLWRSLSEAGQKHVDEMFGAARFRRYLADLLESTTNA